MRKKLSREIQNTWDALAEDWNAHIGFEGDTNRRLNSDPVLWKFAGDVSGKNVLDAGCGTGYLSRKLADEGASVTGVDISPRMIEIARKQLQNDHPEINFIIDSCSILQNIPDGNFDLIISNYVLMDLPDVKETLLSFHRVLKVNGFVVLIFSHPAFPQGYSSKVNDDGAISYNWHFSYFEQKKCIDPPWGNFSDKFVWFHRPLSFYWKVFNNSGFQVLDFDEPRIDPIDYFRASSPTQLLNNQTRPFSVAFKLKKLP